MEQGAHHSLGVLPGSEKQDFVRIQSESLAIFITPLSALQPNILFTWIRAAETLKVSYVFFPSLDIVKGNYLNALVAD